MLGMLLDPWNQLIAKLIDPSHTPILAATSGMLGVLKFDVCR